MVHTNCLFFVEPTDFRYVYIHPQGLLASKEILKLGIVVLLTAREGYDMMVGGLD